MVGIGISWHGLAMRYHKISRNDTKRTLENEHPAKILISLRSRAIWTESSFTQSDQNLHWAHFGQARMQSFFMWTTKILIRLLGSMCRISWVFVRRTCQKVRFLTFRLKWFLRIMITLIRQRLRPPVKYCLLSLWWQIWPHENDLF